MSNLSPTKKGLITGVLMIASSIGIFFAKGNFQNSLQYVTYCLYIAGILWTLIDFKRRNNFIKFKDFFSEGFKCFVVVTLLMVVFTFAFLLLNPQIKVERLAFIKEEMVKTKMLTPGEINSRIDMERKFFIPGSLMGAVFGYLLIGVVFTVITAGFLWQKKNDVGLRIIK